MFYLLPDAEVDYLLNIKDINFEFNYFLSTYTDIHGHQLHTVSVYQEICI